MSNYFLGFYCVVLSLLTFFIVAPTARVYADTSSNRPLTIAGICSDPAAGIAKWRIGNSNPNPITLGWAQSSAEAANDSQSFSYGFNVLETKLNPETENSNMTFTQAAAADQTIAINTEPCSPPQSACVDGYNRANLTYTWNNSGNVNVETKGNMLLCEDVPIYLSSYQLPSTYDGSGVFNDSSLPQTLFSTIGKTLKQGTTGALSLNVAVPNSCLPHQLDLYYAPEITVVSGMGHGSQLIYGEIVPKTTDCQPTNPEPPVNSVIPKEGGKGGGDIEADVTNEAPSAPAAVTNPVTTSQKPVKAVPKSDVPALLPDTGDSFDQTITFFIFTLLAANALIELKRFKHI